MTTILSIIGALLVITALIVIHELGHFLSGRRLGFAIEEFSVGFGPKLFQRNRNGILYSIRAFPIGGYVRFLGEDEELVDLGAFNNQKIWKRFVTLISGPLANILTAILLAVITIFAFGDYAPSVSAITQGSPAEAAGLQEGDILTGVNDVDILFYQEAADEVAKAAQSGKQVVLTVERGGEELTLVSEFMYSEALERDIIGVTFGSVRVHFSLLESVAISFKWMWYLLKEMIGVVVGLFTFRQDLAELAGTVGIIDILSRAVRSGGEVVLRMATLISLNLGVINLIPFPALDGGRILFIAIEKVIKRPVPRKVESAINMVGLIGLFALIGVLTFQDISRLIGA